ncbi:MAG: lipoyl synthase [Candidatus Reconcilbacillus cellulovorans]|uniref:Lipoyl synthase n=1 Tax=Candidatus Reconcilbacillus cellulovorans TaxID=1906605 RepID=A0A2A6E3V9_9BACL|nr:MAG: lipoyl synthase [Candidatus Reconcilbacillus cellulovorans]
MQSKTAERKPDWLKISLPTGRDYENIRDLRRMMRAGELHTVCEEAKCPNLHECWANRTATFMILGDFCTRACRFCAVKTGRPTGPDPDEPERVAEAAEQMGLRHCVITSVARDDLPDGGAAAFAATVRAVRRRLPLCGIEVLVPDFNGSEAALAVVLEAKPDVLNHNLETVERLTPRVRSRATYRRSLELLARAKRIAPGIRTKSGLMVGLGEEWDEILQAMDDLREAGCDMLTIGQYLRPTPAHLPVVRFYAPEEFARLKEEGLRRGFRHVESGPLVRSSYHAGEQAKRAEGM